MFDNCNDDNEFDRLASDLDATVDFHDYSYIEASLGAVNFTEEELDSLINS